MMKKRQSVFLQILVFFLCGTLYGAPYSAGTGVVQPVLPMTFAAGTVDRIPIQEFIRDRMQTLTKMIGVPPGARAVDCRLHFDGTAEKASLRLTRIGKGVELAVSGPFSLWKEDFSLQRRLSGALLLSQFGIVPDMADSLPCWMQGAIESNLRAGQYPSLFRKSRYLPGLRYVLSTGKLPDFHTLLAADPEAMVPEVRYVYFDLCRYLLETAYLADPARAVLRDYVLTERQSNPAAVCRGTLDRVLADAGRKYALQNAIDFSGLADAECARRYWELHAEKVAFNRSYCYEPEAALARFRKFRKVTVTETKDKKKFQRTMDLAELPDWQGDENTGKLLMLQKTKEFQRISGCFGDEHAAVIQRLGDALRSQLNGSVWRAGSGLAAALNDFEQSLKLSILRDRFAARQEEKVCPPLLLSREELSVVRRPDSPFLSRQALRFVDGAERDYLWQKGDK